MFWRSAAMWCGLVVIGLLNATLRQTTYARVVSERTAHQISTITCVLGVLIGAHFVLRRTVMRLEDRALVLIGMGWAAATILFEFSFGRLVVRDSWSTLLENYNLPAGRVWIAVPVAILFAPLLVKRFVAHSSTSRPRVSTRSMSRTH